MSKYKVLVIGMLIKGNLMAKAGDVLGEESFLTTPEELKKTGHIEDAFLNKEEISEKTKDEIKDYAEEIGFGDLDESQKKADMVEDLIFFIENGVAPDPTDDSED